MSKFNVGDIVIGNAYADVMYSITKKGTMWKVTSVCDDEVNVRDENGTYCGLTERAFDLYKPRAYTFKVGDEVKLAPHLEVNESYEGITFFEDMIFSEPHKVEEVSSAGDYKIGNYFYSSEMLIPTHSVTPEIVEVHGKKWVVYESTEDKLVLKPYENDVINVGDTVKITNNGHSYNTSLKWFDEIIAATHIISKDKAEEYCFRFAYDGLPTNGTEYKVLGKSTNEKSGRSNKTIYLICRDTQVYIIGEKGVEKVNG